MLVCIPIRDDLRNQFVLAPRGILKFIHQKVMDAVAPAALHFWLKQSVLRIDAGLDKIDDRVFTKHHPELRCCVQQDGDDAADGLPLLVRESFVWQSVKCAKRFDQAVDGCQLLQECLEVGLVFL